MTVNKRDDMVLISFLFSDESRQMHRPAVVPNSPVYHRDRQEVVVAAVAGIVDRLLFGDHLLGWGYGARYIPLFPGSRLHLAQACYG